MSFISKILLQFNNLIKFGRKTLEFPHIFIFDRIHLILRIGNASRDNTRILAFYDLNKDIDDFLSNSFDIDDYHIYLRTGPLLMGYKAVGFRDKKNLMKFKLVVPKGKGEDKNE